MAILSAEEEALNLVIKMRRTIPNPVIEKRPGGVHRQHLRFAFVAVTALSFATGPRWLSAQSTPSNEYQVKAAFLFHFAQFVDWPREAFKDANSPLTYCTIGDDPFRGALDTSLNGKIIGTRPLRVRHLKQTQEVHGCHVLFIGTAEKKQFSAVLAALRGDPVLTVGESDNFAQAGGMIGFSLEDNKVRFEINLDAAQRANLRISARLLSLAKTVIGSTKGT